MNISVRNFPQVNRNDLEAETGNNQSKPEERMNQPFANNGMLSREEVECLPLLPL